MSTLSPPLPDSILSGNVPSSAFMDAKMGVFVYAGAAMTTQSNEPAELPAEVQRRVRRLRWSAAMILVLGLVGAAVVYWVGSRREALPDDPAMVGFDRATQRQMGLLYGKQGQLIEDLNNWVKQPSTQALLVAAGAAVVALVLFQASRVLEFEARNPVPQDERQSSGQ
jgi:hypothetical protein